MVSYEAQGRKKPKVNEEGEEGSYYHMQTQHNVATINPATAPTLNFTVCSSITVNYLE